MGVDRHDGQQPDVLQQPGEVAACAAHLQSQAEACGHEAQPAESVHEDEVRAAVARDVDDDGPHGARRAAFGRRHRFSRVVEVTREKRPDRRG
ncbi:MAG: hypothetical protein ACXV3A_05455 [Kineosporiaceae bacterium]